MLGTNQILIWWTWIARKSICIQVSDAHLVYNIKVILLEQQSPPGKLASEFVRFHEPLQWLMVGHQGKSLPIQVGPEMSYGPNCSQSLPLIGWIIGLCVDVASRSKHNNKLTSFLILLSQNCSKTHNAPISVQLKGLWRIWTSKNKRWTELLL